MEGFDHGTAWRGSASSCGLQVLALLMLAGAAGMLPATLFNDDHGRLVGAVLVVTISALFIGGFARLEAWIDGEGLHAETAPVAFYRMTIPHGDVRTARVVAHRTLSFGISAGLGYRGSLRLFRRAAWVLRTGPALELDLSRGRRFTITVDDAEGALAALQPRG